MERRTWAETQAKDIKNFRQLPALYSRG